MKYNYDGKEYTVCLVDDGTLDTVFTVNGKTYRFDSEYMRDEITGAVSEEAITKCVETYLEDMANEAREELIEERKKLVKELADAQEKYRNADYMVRAPISGQCVSLIRCIDLIDAELDKI